MTQRIALDPGATTRPRPLWPYIATVVVAGCLAYVALTAWNPAATTVPTSPLLFVALIVVTMLGEWAALDLRAGESGFTLSLLEVAVVIDLLALPPTLAVLAIVGGVALRELFSRRLAQKVVFNVGQHALAASIAAVVVAIAPTAPLINPGRVVAVLIATLLYSLTNTLALAGVFSRLGITTIREQLMDRPVFLAATTLGNASVGVLAVAIWTAYPTIVWIIAAPAAALYLSYGSSFRIEALLDQVRGERDRLDRVVSGVYEGIVLVDSRGEILIWNVAMGRILGVDAADAVGRPATTLLSGTDAEGVLRGPLDGIDTDHGAQVQYQAQLRGADGEPVHVRILRTVLRDLGGDSVGAVLVVHDLERERAAASVKEDFVARVSHELRTPLTPIRGYAQTLIRAGDRVDEHKRNEALALIVERVDHMERLIDDLLLVSRIGAGPVEVANEVDCEPVDLRELVDRLVGWLQRDVATGRDLQIELGDGPLVAWCDSLRTGQILTNLVTNACKYSREGAPISLRLAAEDGYVTLSVCDEGPGIPEDELESIFERFQRLEDPMRMRTGGLGLGLYISRHFAEAMAGTLTARSTRGVGSEFTLRLPAAAADTEAAPAARSLVGAG